MLRRFRVVSRPYRIPPTLQLGDCCRFSVSTLPCTITAFPFSLPLLAKSSRVYIYFPPCGHKPPPTLRYCLNLLLCLQRRHFPIACFVKRPDIALYAVGPLFLRPIQSSPHCTLKGSQHDLLWQPPIAHSEKRPRLQKFSRVQRRLSTATPGFPKSTVVGGYPKHRNM